MKKVIPFAFAFLFISVFAFSQDMVIKPTVGINFTNFSKDPGTGKYKSQVGYQIGGSIAFGHKLYVEPGVFYAQKSTDYIYSLSGINSTTNFKLSGVRIPVAVGYSIIGGDSKTDPIGVRIYGGGSAFILTSVNQGSKSDYNSTDWGVFAGAGLDIGIVFVDAKYEWSLTNIQKDITQIDIGQTRTIYINAGIRIPLGQ